MSTSIQEEGSELFDQKLEHIKGLILTGMAKFVRMEDTFLISIRTMKKELNYELHEAYGRA